MKRLILGFSVIACLALAGCGGGSGSDDSGGGGGNSGGADSSDSQEIAETPPPTKSTFIKQADAICSKGKREVESELGSYLEKEGIKEIGESGESPSETKAHEVEVIETIGIPALDRQLDELKALAAPSGDEAKVNAYLSAVEDGIERGAEEPQTLFRSADKIFAESDKLAGDVGFKVCGNR